MSWPCALARQLCICETRLMAPGRLLILQSFEIIERLPLLSSVSQIMPGIVISMDTQMNP